MCNWRLIQFIIFLLVLLSLCSCIQVKTEPDFLYISPVFTYIRECPQYDCKVVAEVYNADKVKVLNKKGDGWVEVQIVNNQKIGWTQSDLLSKVLLIEKNYYVTEDNVPLRDSPSEEVISRKLLDRGDKVQKIDEHGQGWWRVLVEKDKSIGWIPGTLVSEKLPDQPWRTEKALKTEPSAQTAKEPSQTQTPSELYYYVAAKEINLHPIPLRSTQVVKVLKRNDKVEKISQSGKSWLKVRYPGTNEEGWALTRYFKDSPVPEKTKKAHKTPPPAQTAKKPSHTQTPSKPYYYVAGEKLNLHIIPLRSSRVVKVLKLNDKVEKISQPGDSWVKVRYLGTKAEGWALARYFKDSPVTDKKQIVTKKRRYRRRSPVKKQPAPGTVEPEGM